MSPRQLFLKNSLHSVTVYLNTTSAHPHFPCHKLARLTADNARPLGHGCNYSASATYTAGNPLIGRNQDCSHILSNCVFVRLVAMTMWVQAAFTHVVHAAAYLLSYGSEGCVLKPARVEIFLPSMSLTCSRPQWPSQHRTPCGAARRAVCWWCAALPPERYCTPASHTCMHPSIHPSIRQSINQASKQVSSPMLMPQAPNVSICARLEITTPKCPKSESSMRHTCSSPDVVHHAGSDMSCRVLLLLGKLTDTAGRPAELMQRAAGQSQRVIDALI